MSTTGSTAAGRFPLVQALRPAHWVKNVFVLAALVFAGRLDDPASVGRALAAFVVFCLISSAGYLVNDVADRERDRLHPLKKQRPVAAGRLGVPVVLVTAAALGVAGLGGAVALGRGLTLVVLLYLATNLTYSFLLKRVVVLDVMLLAAGFLLRAWAGAVVLHVGMSHWLILCTGLIALFLGFVKRRQEVSSLTGAPLQRPILAEYSLPFLDQMIAVVTASTVLAYALYVFSPEVGQKLGTRSLGLTLPFVLYGIFRYLYLVYQRGQGENPTELVLSDRSLQVAVFLWAVAVVVALYIWR